MTAVISRHDGKISGLGSSSQLEDSERVLLAADSLAQMSRARKSAKHQTTANAAAHLGEVTTRASLAQCSLALGVRLPAEPPYRYTVPVEQQIPSFLGRTLKRQKRGLHCHRLPKLPN